MNGSFAENAAMFGKGRGLLLRDGKWGIERESQRVTTGGDLALTPHPAAFGNKLENPAVTTDFSESQIELVTPPFASVEDTLGYLEKLQFSVETELKDEMLWPLSMPPRLPDEDEIPIARFDGSPEGLEREIYRNGLALRYGKKMQMISGIHYNFSFGEKLLDYLYWQRGSGMDRRSFTDDLYFSAARNFLRYRWLLIYLFGASPDMDPTYYPVVDQELEIISRCCPECCSPAENVTKNATSLRVSRFGYSDSSRGKYGVSYNSLEDYINSIRTLLSLESEKFRKMGLYKDGRQIQLNGNILQKESEFYSAIRLKQIVAQGESQLNALESGGVRYAEVRIIDLDPFEKAGISLQQMHFLQVFMMFCLLEKSGPIYEDELDRINRNHHLVSLAGRRRNLRLYNDESHTIPLREWSKILFEKISKVAVLMDDSDCMTYRTSVEHEYRKVLDPALLPSALIRKEMMERGETFLEFGIRKALEHRGEDYTGLELSTQMIIKDALRRGVEVEILDRSDNFIRLSKGERTEYVKQATRTSADTYIAPLIMENKEVTKIILQENGINVPQGITAQSMQAAISYYPDFCSKDIVIKPKSTNFGKGVVILRLPYNEDDYRAAAELAFHYDSSILIEEFIPGREFRFLVIGGETVAILHRVPANVTGDGIHTIEELVAEKNLDPLRGKGYVTPLEKISLGETEREYLRFQEKDFKHVPKLNETVFLRENSNISTGGDSIDFTEDIIDEYKEIAVKAAKAVGAKICGADIIIRDIGEKPDRNNHSIIELNFNPALHIHNYPYKGKNRHVEGKVLDQLGFGEL